MSLRFQDTRQQFSVTQPIDAVRSSVDTSLAESFGSFPARRLRHNTVRRHS